MPVWPDVLGNPQSIPAPAKAAITVRPTMGGPQEKAVKKSRSSELMTALKTSIAFLEHRLADHPVLLAQAELAQDGGGDIEQLRRGSPDLAIAEQPVGNFIRRHAVIADPGLGIVLQRHARNGAQSGLPRCAAAAAEAYQNIGSV